MKMAKKEKKTQKIERHRRDIFGVANEIYVANTRKLKAFLGVLEEFIPFHRNEWKNTKIRTKSIKSRYERKFLFRFFCLRLLQPLFISSSKRHVWAIRRGDFNLVAPSKADRSQASSTTDLNCH